MTIVCSMRTQKNFFPVCQNGWAMNINGTNYLLNSKPLLASREEAIIGAPKDIRCISKWPDFKIDIFRMFTEWLCLNVLRGHVSYNYCCPSILTGHDALSVKKTERVFSVVKAFTSFNQSLNPVLESEEFLHIVYCLATFAALKTASKPCIQL